MATRDGANGSGQGRTGGRGALGARISTSLPESRALRSSRSGSPFAEYKLPAGRTGIPRGLAAANQRWRLLGAAALILFEEGYAATTVAKIATCAGVSRKTFYEHFDDLTGCMLATYRMAAESLLEAVEGACGEAGEGDPLALAVRRGLEFAAAEPSLAHLLGAETPVGLPALAEEWGRLENRLAGLLAAVRGEEAASGGSGSRSGEGDASVTPSIGDKAMVGAALVLVADRIGKDGDGEGLDALEPSLIALLGRAPAPPVPL